MKKNDKSQLNRLPIVEQCEGCLKIFQGEDTLFSYCEAYLDPSAWWKHEWGCTLKTTKKLEVKSGKDSGRKLNPIKASKRGSGR